MHDNNNNYNYYYYYYDNDNVNDRNLAMDIPRGGSSCSRPPFPGLMTFAMLIFVEGGKLDDPEKNPWSKEENQQQTPPTRFLFPRAKNQTWTPVVGGDRSYNRAIPALSTRNFLTFGDI